MRSWILLIALACALTSCAGPPHHDPVAATAPDGRGAIRPLPEPTGCTTIATDGDRMRDALAKASPGERLCVLGTLGNSRLTIARSGTAARPITIVGDGHTVVRGITVRGNNVVVDGINSIRGWAPGIELTGNNITLRNNTSITPRGDDDDGLRFYGNHIRIVHNTIRDTLNLQMAHADCMQTFATGPDNPASQDVLIAHNRCEQVDNMCLIAEGPHSSAGDGSGRGESDDFVYADNYCESHASQALEFDDIQRVSVLGNEIAFGPEKAFAFQNNSSTAFVALNRINPHIGYQVGIDSSSMPQYRGPAPGGTP